ncbi:MAG: DUF1489 family protein [Alphaproteobacteria bacterium]|nr:DUF1489 family protein [Alphaproteobacteria bacterium]
MPLHLIKLCVGVEDVEELEDWRRKKAAEARRRGRKPVIGHRTRMMPKRREEILAGGSLYWVIKGVVQVRAPILDLAPVVARDGTHMCDIRMSPKLIRTEPMPHRPFQGWRYLEAGDAPRDLAGGAKAKALPAHMVAELRSLGLL